MKQGSNSLESQGHGHAFGRLQPIRRDSIAETLDQPCHHDSEHNAGLIRRSVVAFNQSLRATSTNVEYPLHA